MIFPEKQQSLGYVYDKEDFTETYFYGDFMRKTSLLLKDENKKWEFYSRVENIQQKEWPTQKSYREALQKTEKDLANHVSVNENPFIL